MEITNQGIPLGHRQTEIGVIPEDWDIKKFGELGTFYKGRGISMKDTVADGLPCIMYGDIYVKYNTKFSNPDFKITLETAARSTRARRGDLLFTASGETAEEIGKCVTYIGCEDIYIGGDIIGMTPNAGVEPLYLSYSQNSFPLLAQKANLGQGYTVVHISMDHIKSIKVALPPSTKEQSAIVTVLSDIDRLLIKLDTLIQKKKLIKQGAMQELLTGKRRLPGFQNAWITKPIKEIEAIPVSDGPHLTPRFIETGVPFFSVNNLGPVNKSFRSAMIFSCSPTNNIKRSNHFFHQNEDLRSIQIGKC